MSVRSNLETNDKRKQQKNSINVMEWNKHTLHSAPEHMYSTHIVYIYIHMYEYYV